jgi:hypothetical protein
MSRRPAAQAFAGAALVGLVGGWLMARRHDRAHRHDLFSPRAYRRFAALGWLASEGDADQVPILLDYLTWEPVPALRARARQVIASLGAVTP